MREIGEQWVEVIDGREHILKAIKQPVIGDTRQQAIDTWNRRA